LFELPAELKTEESTLRLTLVQTFYRPRHYKLFCPTAGSAQCTEIAKTLGEFLLILGGLGVFGGNNQALLLWFLFVLETIAQGRFA
jgi:hypothetical protein